MNIFSCYRQIDIIGDPILSYEMKDANPDENATLYDLLGYDELVPNENFARLMNIHGEFQVGEMIYKVSPRGTYYFLEKDLDYFESSYSEFEQVNGTQIAERTYHMGQSVYRYDTFLNPEDMLIETKAVTMETHVGTASQVFENQIFYNNYTDGRRMKTRVYNHDYVVYQERGAYVKLQKKAWIGWSDMSAEGLGLSWNNIIMTKNYDGNNGKPLSGQRPVANNPFVIQFNGKSQSVFEIFGYSIPESYYDIIARGNAATVRNKILADTGIDVFGYQILRLDGFNYVQYIYLADVATGSNVEEVKVAFSNNTMGQCFKFAAGQFYYSIFGANPGSGTQTTLASMRVGTAF